MKILYLTLLLSLPLDIFAERSEKEKELIRETFKTLESNLPMITDRDIPCMRFFIQAVHETTVTWSVVSRNNQVCGGNPLLAPLIGIYDVSIDKSIGVWSDLCNNHVSLDVYLDDDINSCPINCWYESKGKEFLDQVSRGSACPKTTKLYNGDTATLLEYSVPGNN